MLTVVTGPPCSGKSTYVRERAAPGDIVVDYDLLAQALTIGGTPYDPSDPVRWTAIAARAAAVRTAIVWHQRGYTAWVIHTRIPHGELARYEREGAHIVRLDAPLEVLHARAAQARPARWRQLIDEWTPEAPPSPRRRRERQPSRSHTDPEMRKGRKGRPYRRWQATVLARSRVCWICGHDGADSADHIVPLTRGGAPTDPDNGAPAHHQPCPTCGRRCNSSRGAAYPEVEQGSETSGGALAPIVDASW